MGDDERATGFTESILAENAVLRARVTELEIERNECNDENHYDPTDEIREAKAELRAALLRVVLALERQFPVDIEEINLGVRPGSWLSEAWAARCAARGLLEKKP